MYGLLIEGIYYYIKSVFGEDILNEVMQTANIKQANFCIHKVYSESVIPRLAQAVAKVTGMPAEQVMESFGITYVSFLSKYGYDRMLKALGRTLGDFLSNLDNLHEYLRFSYPKIKPPSFFVTDEGPTGLQLQYRSKRKGFVSYVIGQIKQVGRAFYDTDVQVEVIDVNDSGENTKCIFRLQFDNSSRHEILESERRKNLFDENSSTISSKLFFNLFPFHMVIDQSLKIKSAGDSLAYVMKNSVGSQLDDLFSLQRPLIEFSFDSIVLHTNNLFELKSLDTFSNRDDELTNGTSNGYHDDSSEASSQSSGSLVLRGQMMYMQCWNAVLFLGTPIIEDLEQMFGLGLYINDLSIHDSSRELILAGTQQSAELKLLLDQEQHRSKRLEESMKKLDEERKKTDTLLYQMIPKSVADRLRSGEPALNTCEVVEACTVMFSDVVGFTNICSVISPMQVVTMLNSMYTSFDTVIEKQRCYKVETIGDAYMVVSGVPNRSDRHAQDVADMAFAMLNCIRSLKNPTDKTGKTTLQLRIGIHSGMVVAGVVGLKMPRYCLFGDTVNTASRMETTGEAMKVHISEATKQYLEPESSYTTEIRGVINVKGKGEMLTYWLHAEENKRNNFKHRPHANHTSI